MGLVIGFGSKILCLAYITKMFFLFLLRVLCVTFQYMSHFELNFAYDVRLLSPCSSFTYWSSCFCIICWKAFFCGSLYILIVCICVDLFLGSVFGFIGLFIFAPISHHQYLLYVVEYVLILSSLICKTLFFKTILVILFLLPSLVNSRIIFWGEHWKSNSGPVLARQEICHRALV